MNKQKSETIYRLKRCHVCGMIFNALRDSCPNCYEDVKVELIEKKTNSRSFVNNQKKDCSVSY